MPKALIGIFASGPKELDRTDRTFQMWCRRLASLQGWARTRLGVNPLYLRTPDDLPIPCTLNIYRDEDLQEVINLDPGTIWRELHDLWENGSPDMDWEEDGVRRKVYCGWPVLEGDVPQGEGYRTIRLAFDCGLAQLLGLH